VVFEHILLDDGHDVDATATVLGGDDLLRRSDYDLLVSDGRLPDGTGMTLADKAREKGIPSLIVTGYAFNLRDSDCVDLSAYNVLLKPMRPAELLGAIARLLRGENLL
jgi:DNA-binding NtrC family response regulator